MNFHNAYEIEVCVDSVESAIGAEKCCADRVELCSRLDLDGLTPDLEIVKKCRDEIDISLHVMIRPESGPFTATEPQLELMIRTIEAMRKIGVDGVVFGILNKNNQLVPSVLSRLMEASVGLSVTFHRAFDVCQDPLETFRKLKMQGVNRLLTSGQKPSAIEGIDLIGELVDAAGDQVGIMAGSCVNGSNIPLLWNVGVRQFHFTSHAADAKGTLIFDPTKTTAAKEVLERLCDS